jgi:glycosyltransferase involved in cell wall biosynthesis
VVTRSTPLEGPTTSVIIAAFDQPRELALVLSALAAQTETHFDVIVADDGSNPPASEVIDSLREELPFEIRCVWQEDAGFRKARALNRAVHQTDAELVVFLDGDCLPFRDLVATYRHFYTPGEFLVGAVAFADAESSRRLTPKDARRAVSLRERRRLLSIHLRNLLHRGGKQTRPRIRGGNFAVSSALFRRVDGFDEVYCGYGKEDSDLRNRMRNAGALGTSLWLRAWAVHLERSVAPSGSRAAPPPELYAEGRRLVRARRGLSTHAGESPRPEPRF